MARRAAGKPFVAVNCGAMPEISSRSILFGHEKGSFTGATERHVGKFVRGVRRHIILDEVGEFAGAGASEALARHPGGARSSRSARASRSRSTCGLSRPNRDLIADVKAGRFREDLFYRLHVFPITVRVRERPADIPALVPRIFWRALRGGR